MPELLETAHSESAAPAAPGSFQEWKTARAAGTADAPTAEPADNGPSAVPQGESAAPPAGATQETQDKPKGRTQKTETAEERAAKLRAAGRVQEAERIERDAADKREFEEWRKNRGAEDPRIKALEEKIEALTRKPADPQKPTESAAPKAAEKRLTRKEFFALPENQERPYDDVAEAWDDMRAQYVREDALKAFEERTAASQRTRTIQEKVAAAKQGKPDFDAVAGKVQLYRDNLAALLNEFDNGLDVLYHIGKDPELTARLAPGAVSPARQLAELGVLSHQLAQPPAEPEKPRDPATQRFVSRTPAPPRTLGGTGSASADDGKAPVNFKEWKARKRRAG